MSFEAAMQRLYTDPGVSARTLPTLAAGILGIAAPPPEEIDEEAAKLARETLFDYATWLYVVDRIHGHPERDALLNAALDVSAMLGESPAKTITALIGDGEPDGCAGAMGNYTGGRRR